MHDANLLAKAEGSRSIDNASDTKQTAATTAKQQNSKTVAAASVQHDNERQQRHLTTCKCDQPSNRPTVQPSKRPDVQLTD